MNQKFQQFLQLPAIDRQDIFEAEAAQLGTLASYVEKDFWVCCVLDILYNGLPLAWKKFDEAVPGSLFVVPTGELLAIVQRDYLAMQEMMTGDVPKFEDIIRSLAEFESLVNEKGQGGFIHQKKNLFSSQSVNFRY